MFLLIKLDKLMIKVLHIIQDINSGGVERRRLSIAKEIKNTEFELKIICIKAQNQIPNLIQSHGVEIFELESYSGPFDFAAHLKVQKIIDAYRPDIIHGAVFEGVTLAAINGFIKKVPHIVIEETSDPSYRSWRANLLLKFLGMLSDYAIAVSIATQKYLTQTISLPPRKIRLIVNGVSPAKKQDAMQLKILQEKLHISDSDFIFISVGRMNSDYIKRFSDVIRSFKIVSKKHPNAKLILVGDGVEKEKYIQLSHDLEIFDRIIFTGYQPNVDQYLAISHVFCLFSAHESFGLAAVEAQMNRVPVVVTKVGGLQYTVVPNQTGLVVPPNDLQAASEAMLFAIENPVVMKEMGEKAFTYVTENFSEDQYLKTLFNFYREITNSKNVSS